MAIGPATAPLRRCGGSVTDRNAGSASIVHMIAGLVSPDRGRIALGDQVLFDSAARINVPAHRRRIGTVFQEGRLFPHLTVAQNIAFGLEMEGKDVHSLNDYEVHLTDKLQFLLDADLGFITTEQNDLFKVMTIWTVVGIRTCSFSLSALIRLT